MNDDNRITTGVTGVGCIILGTGMLLFGVLLWMIATFDSSRWAG